jgi:transglutaminase-like putative cysteine protease
MASRRRTAAAACAVILASLSLYPLFIGVAWFWAGCGAVAVAALTGSATRVRRLPVALVLPLGVLALLLYLNLAFSNARSLYHLLPTPASLAALWHAAGQGFSEASAYAPPVPELRGMVLLATAGIGITALLTDLIAVRLGSAALAGLPLLLLFGEPFTVSSVSRGFLATTIVFCAGVAGYLALLSSEGRDRIREWERQDPAEGDAPDTRPLAAAGRRVGFASVVVALCLPLFIPGLHMTRLFGGGPGIGGTGGNGGGASVGFPSPTTQLSQELHSGKASTVLVYTSTTDSPDYLQIYALNKLTDSGWQLFGQPESLVAVDPRLPAAPGLTTSAGTTRETTHITIASGIGSDALGALPVPYPATAVTASGLLHADKSTLMVFDPDVSISGLRYSVTSLAELPSTQSLNDAAAPPADIVANDQAVPASYDSLRALATSIAAAAGAKTQYQKAVALQDWLANGKFSYTLNAPSVVDAAGLKQFLTVTKKGYCQQFSFAMAVLARLLDIPSRVAYGFTSGTEDSAGSWVVTTHDAHAWPELYFQGYGWLRFEPTPTGSTGQGTAYQPIYSVLPTNLDPSSSQTVPTSSPSPAATGGLNSSNVPPNLRYLLDGGGSGAGASGGAGTVNPWEIGGLVAAGLVLLAAVAPWCARRVIRRRRWRRGRAVPLRADTVRTDTARAAPNQADGIRVPQVRADRVRARDVAWAHAAWRELRDDLADYGAGARPSESPRAAAARAGERLRLADPAREALGRIAIAEERARYAPAPADGSTLRADSAAVRRAIAAAVPRRVRWRARLLPSSVLRPALGTVTSATDLYRGALPGPRTIAGPGHGRADRGQRRRPGRK